MSESQKNRHAKALGHLGASKGGVARAKGLSNEERSEIARLAAAARWRRGAEVPIRATHAGVVKIGDMALDCANLPDGRRVISEAAMMRALGRGYSGYYSKRDAAGEAGLAVLPRYVAPLALRPFIGDELQQLLLKPIAYFPPGSGNVNKGIEAEVLPKICKVWLDARSAGRLNPAQLRTAAKAEILALGLAEVGIIALVDEATGYQDARARDALAKILEAFIAKELRKWVRTFPAEFYKELFRLRGWVFPNLPEEQRRRPVLVGKLTNDIVYARLAPGVREELHRLTPRDDKGRLKHKLFQRLSEETGHPKLREHLASVIALMRASDSWPHFIHLLDRALPRFGDTMMLALEEHSP